MPLINLVIVLVVVGVILWLVKLHTDAGYHKEDSECRRDYCGDPLAIECLRCHRKPLNDPHWELKGLKILSRN